MFQTTVRRIKNEDGGEGWIGNLCDSNQVETERVGMFSERGYEVITAPVIVSPSHSFRAIASIRGAKRWMERSKCKHSANSLMLKCSGKELTSQMPQSQAYRLHTSV